jgi:hypothetical protein
VCDWRVERVGKHMVIQALSFKKIHDEGGSSKNYEKVPYTVDEAW